MTIENYQKHIEIQAQQQILLDQAVHLFNSGTHFIKSVNYADLDDSGLASEVTIVLKKR